MQNADGYGRFSQISSARAERQREAEILYREQSQERLTNTISSKLKTTFIGSLAAVEEVFGFLWGQGRYPDFLIDEEVEVFSNLSHEFDILRDILRTKILNLGNAQKRAAEEEISLYDVKWNRHRYVADGTQDTIAPLFVNEDGTPKIRKGNK